MTNVNIPVNDPLWLANARKYVGLKEVPGKGNNPIIQNWLRQLKAWWSDDATPWCGTFVGAMLQSANRFVPPSPFAAMSYKKCGTALMRPAYGCVVVFTRDGGGHVGFLVGFDKHANLMILGGNQGDMVSIKPFSSSRVVGYYWPALANGTFVKPLDYRYDVPLVNSNGVLSTNEA